LFRAPRISTTCCARCSSRPFLTATSAARRCWVERIVVDRPEVSTFFTPLSICLNIDSFEHLEFETRPDQLIVYTLVQGDERIVVEFAPVGRSEGDEPEQQAFAFPATADYVQMELSAMDGGEGADPAGESSEGS
jgi:hypothetical protein